MLHATIETSGPKLDRPKSIAGRFYPKTDSGQVVVVERRAVSFTRDNGRQR